MEHDRFAQSNDIAVRDRRLSALETAISISATLAARALEVPHPDPPVYGGFDRLQLCRLLRALEAEGLVLPSEVGLLAPDSRL